MGEERTAVLSSPPRPSHHSEGLGADYDVSADSTSPRDALLIAFESSYRTELWFMPSGQGTSGEGLRPEMALPGACPAQGHLVRSERRSLSFPLPGAARTGHIIDYKGEAFVSLSEGRFSFPLPGAARIGHIKDHKGAAFVPILYPRSARRIDTRDWIFFAQSSAVPSPPRNAEISSSAMAVTSSSAASAYGTPQ